MELVKYKPSPGGLGDADWFNSPESQWWTVRRDDGVVGLVPMTSLELIAEVQKNGEMTQVQNLGAGYASADSASKKAPGAHPGEKDRTWVMPENEWNVGCCGRIRKILGEQVLYNEWSKWAQLFAAYVVIFEGVAMVVWDINENSRLTGVTDNNTMPWEYSYCGYENLAPDAVVIPDCCEPGGQRSPATTVRLRHFLASCANFLLNKHAPFQDEDGVQVSNEYIYCKHEVGLPHILIGLVTIAIYVVFIAFERSRGYEIRTEN